MSGIFVETEEQRAILETVRRFNQAVVKPVAADLDRRNDPADCFSWDIVEKADERMRPTRMLMVQVQNRSR